MKPRTRTAYPLLGYELGTNEARPTLALLNLRTEEGVHSYTLDGEGSTNWPWSSRRPPPS
jgi:hypothetical protein